MTHDHTQSNPHDDHSADLDDVEEGPVFVQIELTDPDQQFDQMLLDQSKDIPAYQEPMSAKELYNQVDHVKGIKQAKSALKKAQKKVQKQITALEQAEKTLADRANKVVKKALKYRKKLFDAEKVRFLDSLQVDTSSYRKVAQSVRSEIDVKQATQKSVASEIEALQKQQKQLKTQLSIHALDAIEILNRKIKRQQQKVDQLQEALENSEQPQTHQTIVIEPGTIVLESNTE
ncbi:MAG: hypothetical protein HQL54_00885 [Magnetococcales bacterium]|nr:hypothetical protein [Magnetococcales bacterium]